jgi:hypothetical protein
MASSPDPTDGNELIPGIYNYCDRWCERCPLTERCEIYAGERRTRAAHIAAGRDPDHRDVVVNDAINALETGLALLVSEAGKLGLDTNPLDDAEDHAVTRPFDHPLHKGAIQLTVGIHDLLGETDELGRHVRSPEDPLDDALEVLSHMMVIIPSKIFRALTSAAAARADGEAYDRADADGSAKVAHLCLGQALLALTSLHQRWPSRRKEALQLLLLAQALTEAVIAEFPRCREFRRPGFDD